jgi:hypothetical protein
MEAQPVIFLIRGPMTSLPDQREKILELSVNG